MNAIITNLIGNIFHVIWLCALTVDPKHSKRETIAMSIASMTLYEIICVAGLIWDGARTKEYFLLWYFIGVVIIFVTYVYFLSSGSKQKSGFFFSGYISVYVLIYFFAEFFSGSLFGGAAWAVWVGRIVLNTACLVLYERKLKKYVIEANDDLKRHWGIMLMVSILVALLLTMFLVYIYVYDAEGIFPILLMLCALVMSVAVYYMLFWFIAQQQHYVRSQVIERQNLLLGERIKNYELSEETTRIARHNQRHHNMIISEYAQNGDCESIIKYLGEYDTVVNEKKICENRTVNAIVSAYIKKAAQKYAELTADIRISSVVEVNDIDMVSILGNILDNAINGCMEASVRKKIHLTMKEKDSKLIICCKNSCSSNVRFENELPKNMQRHGIGVTSIIKTAQKYSGIADFSAKDGIFTCAVILNPNDSRFLRGRAV